MAHGIMPLYTPIGSGLNMAESIQRVLVSRALAGQHPAGPEQLIQWMEAVARGWNAAPTPFVWGGRRALRRQQARGRRYRLRTCLQSHEDRRLCPSGGQSDEVSQ